MQSKLYILLFIQTIFIICSLSYEQKLRKNDTIVDYKKKYNAYEKENNRQKIKPSQNYNDDDDDEADDYNYNHQPLTYYNDHRYASAPLPPSNSIDGNYRTRPRWPAPSPSPLDSLLSGNDWSRYEHVNSYPGSLSSLAYDSNPLFNNGPTCHSLIDPQYPIFSDMCGAVPQARYSLPNTFGHRERWQIAQILTTLVGSSAEPGCTRSLRLLLCPVLFPPCQTRHEPPPVLPCQSYCRAVKSRCSIPALELLPCEILPYSSDICPTNQPYGSFIPPGAYPPMAQPLPVAPSAYPSLSRSFPSLQSLLSSPGIQSAAGPAVPSPATQSAQPVPSVNFYNTGAYTSDSLSPSPNDYAPRSYTNDYRQNLGYAPLTRSSTETHPSSELRAQLAARTSASSSSPIVKA